ncbi:MULTISPECIES: RidA family protein [Arthrobacter]|uniref:RidA family protein n=2 Tax=Arthrobacter TaxID=1663 RepID=A0ABU9KS34_9MICC|nr:RidA family protein [Arthrobacter sp. YJM1]MDP5228245.1 RidA family protein [Arthrobacter sp. YJM1]
MTHDHTFGTFSSARVAGGLVFTSGKVGLGADGVRPASFEDEVRAALASLAQTLEEYGSSLENLVQVHCILRDMSDFETFDRIYAEVIPAPVPPRATHGGALVQDFRFEVVGIAELNAPE